MICPRCGREISDTETLCPFCFQDIDKNVVFNDFRKDGFIQIKTKDETDTSTAINYMPKYFDLSELSMLVIAIVFILIVSVFTIFSLKFVQKSDRMFNAPLVSTADEIESTETETVTEGPTVHFIDNITIKNIYGSWRLNTGGVESEYTAVPYYVFDKSGKAYEYYGTVSATGKFKDISEDGDKLVFINIDSGIKGTYNFAIAKNGDGETVLVLTEARSGYMYTLTKVDSAKLVTLKPNAEKELNLDKNLFGYWLTKDKKKSYKFTKDGLVERKTGNITTKGVWDIVKENNVTIQYMKDQLKAIDLEYLQKGNKLKINNIVYYKTQ